MRFFSKRLLWLPVAILAVALRAANYAEVGDTPLGNLHVWTQSDMHFFDAWGRSVAQGELVFARPPRPYHVWHQTIAAEAYALTSGRGEQALTGADESDVAAGGAARIDEAGGRALWDGWLGPKRFYQDPGYPYVLGALFRFAGREPAVLRAFQGLLGVGSVLLVFSIARLLFGASAAVISGLLAALFGPLVFYESLMLRAVLIAFLALAALRLGVSVATYKRDGALATLACGVVCGLGSLVKATAGVYALPILVVGMVVRRADFRSAARFATLLVAGWLLALSPLIARNTAVGEPPFAGAATGAVSFIRHNHAGYSPFTGGENHAVVAQILLDTEGRAVAAVRATIQTHGGALGWAKLLAVKFIAFWVPYEIPNNANYQYGKLLAPVSSAFFVGFALIAPLAGAGFAAAARAAAVGAAPLRAGVFLLAVAALGQLLVCVVFFNLSRFRLPIAMLMLPAAGYGLVEFAAAIRSRGAVRALVPTCGALITAGLILAASLQSGPGRGAPRVADYGVSNKIAVHQIRRAVRAGDIDGALRLARRQLGTEPASLAAFDVSVGRSRLPAIDALASGSFAELHTAVAETFTRAGDPVSASFHRRRALVCAGVDATLNPAPLDGGAPTRP